MSSSHTSSSPHPADGTQKSKYLVAGIVGLVVIIAISLGIGLRMKNRKAGQPLKPAEAYAAELVSANGMVFVAKTGGIDWHQVSVGAHLMEGDWVQTEDLGNASIRYTNGLTVSIQASTILTVRSTGDGSMEISVPYQKDGSSSDGLNPGDGSSASAGSLSGSQPEAADSGKNKGSNPFIKLDRIVRFGRSLELIGSVEAGSRLMVNSEPVEVAGDGSFKHFTNPFPASVDRARIALKVTNLAGKTRLVTTTYDFDPQGGNN